MSQRIQQSPSQLNGRLVVPVAIGRAVPADALFEAELTEEGILFRFIGTSAEEEIALPSWVTNGTKATA